jgi:hypothetical protein
VKFDEELLIKKEKEITTPMIAKILEEQFS